LKATELRAEGYTFSIFSARRKKLLIIYANVNFQLAFDELDGCLEELR